MAIQSVRRLGEFVGSFAGCFGRKGRAEGARRYVAGLLSQAKRKNLSQICGMIEEPGAYSSLHHLISHSNWDETALWERLREFAPRRKGVAICDDTAFPKQGSRSAGVQHQYCGVLGKLASCQVAVSLLLRAGKVSWPLAMDLYLPKAWCQDKKRRESAGIPREVRFRTKHEIALEQIDRAQKSGIEITCALADAAYGDSGEFRAALDARGLSYVVGASGRLMAFAAEPALIAPERKGGKGRPRTKWRLAPGQPGPQSLSDIAQALPGKAWKRVPLSGGRVGRFAALRVFLAGPWWYEPPRTSCWLVIERRTNEIKFYFSNHPGKTPLPKLVNLLKERWVIERHYRDAKQELGLSHFQGRLWRGLHHHFALTAMAYAFLETERRHHRRQGGRLPSLPATRKLLSEILLAQLLSERPDYLRYLQELSRAPPFFGPPKSP